MTPPARIVSGTLDVPDVVDADAIRRAVDDGMPDWAEFREMRAEVQACKAERLKRVARRNYVRAAIGTSVGTFIAGTVFVVRALLAAGASAEAAHVQAEMVRDNAGRIRTLEIQLAETSARLSIVLARPFGPRNQE